MMSVAGQQRMFYLWFPLNTLLEFNFKIDESK